MRKLFKTAILGVSALALPFVFAATVNADTTIKEDIDTILEYQTSTDGSTMRFISTIELKNDRTLDNITNIELYFDLSKDGEETKRSKTTIETKVYEEIKGENGKPKKDDTYYSVFKITDLTKNYTGWSITPYFKYNYSDHSTEIVTASSWIIGVKRQYFVQKYDDWGTNLYYYMFGTNGQNANFPGEQMHLYDADNSIYYFDYMLDAGFTTVVFSDGSDTHKSGDMPVSSSDNYYIQQDGNAYAHPTASHNIVTQYNNNEHYSHCTICGDDFDYERHTLSSTIDSITGKKHITCSDCDFVANLDPNIFYFTAPNEWGDVYVYMWNDKGNNADWPGVKTTNCVGLNEYGQKVYSINTVVNDIIYDKMIFNNGQGTQTADIIKADCGAYNGIYRKDDGSVGYYVYVPENHQE